MSFVSFHEDENKAFSDMGLTNGIPSDEEKPEFGMYFNQLNASKMDCTCTAIRRLPVPHAIRTVLRPIM